MTANDTGNGTVQKSAEETGNKKPAGGQPENKPGADKATGDNDLTTGHTTPGDGGDDNAKP